MIPRNPATQKRNDGPALFKAAAVRRGEVKDGDQSAALGFRKLFNLPLSFSSEGHPSRFGIRIIAAVRTTKGGRGPLSILWGILRKVRSADGEGRQTRAVLFNCGTA